jgi:Galactose oxidase, central domain/Kelch motif
MRPILLALSLALSASAMGDDTFTATGSMAATRYGPSATLLPNGRVLVAGGDANGPSETNALASAELYDPTTGTWSAPGSMATARLAHTATLLGNGKVLVAGGTYYDGGYVRLKSAELFDPATGTWNPTAAMATARNAHTATELANGSVLVAGGYDGSNTATAELYFPVSSSWSNTGSLITARNGHTATLLNNGRVLVAGGYGLVNLSSAELYDPVAGTWSAPGSMAAARSQHTATLLPSGKVLVAGGQDAGIAQASAELFDPSNGTWSPTGIMTAARAGATATLLPNGKVLVAGGYNAGVLASAELYDPANGTWSPTGSMSSPRLGASDVLLETGRVLVLGGSNAGSLASAELYTSTRPLAPPTVAPTVKINGKKKITTIKPTLVIKGSTTGVVTEVTCRVDSKGDFKRAKGSATVWKFTARLKPGKNKITVIATGPGGVSAPAKVTVTRD